MPWGADYQTPDEIAEQRAQQDATLEAQQRAKLSQFERRVVDALTDIAGSLKKIADNTEPIYEYNAQTGRVRVQHGNRAEVQQYHDDVLRFQRDLLGLSDETNTAAGDGGGVSAGPVNPSPGPARPDTDPENPS